jgi:hypothetical protein
MFGKKRSHNELENYFPKSHLSVLRNEVMWPRPMRTGRPAGVAIKIVCNRRTRHFFFARAVLKFNLRRICRLLKSFRNFIRRQRRFSFLTRIISTRENF